VALSLDDLWITEYEDFYVRVSGDLLINTIEVEPGNAVPNVEGEVEVQEGEYYFSLAGVQMGGGFLGPTRFPGWMMNVEVEIPNKFWIRGDDIEAEVQGTLNVKRSEEGLLILGTLRTIRGTFSIYHNAFKIVQGEVRFSDVTSMKNAYINLEAEARVLDEKIEVAVTGFLDNVDVSATSESGWSETQIFEALTLRRVSGPGEDAEQEAFAQALLQSWGMALLNRFGSDVARELRLDRFGVEVENGAAAGDIILSTRVTFGKYVSDNVYLQYTESLGNLYGDVERLRQRGLDEPERTLQVEYRLSDRFTVEGETGTVRGLGYFDVDLKFRYGY
jgi:translocation and assembly module TamB